MPCRYNPLSPQVIVIYSKCRRPPQSTDGSYMPSAFAMMDTSRDLYSERLYFGACMLRMPQNTIS